MSEARSRVVRTRKKTNRNVYDMSSTPRNVCPSCHRTTMNHCQKPKLCYACKRGDPPPVSRTCSSCSRALFYKGGRLCLQCKLEQYCHYDILLREKGGYWDGTQSSIWICVPNQLGSRHLRCRHVLHGIIMQEQYEDINTNEQIRTVVSEDHFRQLLQRCRPHTFEQYAIDPESGEHDTSNVVGHILQHVKGRFHCGIYYVSRTRYSSMMVFRTSHNRSHVYVIEVYSDVFNDDDDESRTEIERYSAIATEQEWRLCTNNRLKRCVGL